MCSVTMLDAGRVPLRATCHAAVAHFSIAEPSSPLTERLKRSCWSLSGRLFVAEYTSRSSLTVKIGRSARILVPRWMVLVAKTPRPLAAACLISYIQVAS